MNKKASFLLLILAFSLLLALPLTFVPSVEANPDVETLKPNAAGDETQLSRSGTAPTNWEACKDDIDSNYVYTTSTQSDLYNLDNFSQTDATISSVIVKIRAMGTSTTPPQNGYVRIKRSGQAAEDSSQISLAGSWTNYSWDITSKESPWTKAKLDVLQVGVKLTGGQGGPVEARCTKVWVEVTYTPPETEKPTYSNVEYLNNWAGEMCRFQSQWNDNTGLSHFWLCWNNTGNWINETASDNWLGSWAYVYKVLNETQGQVIGFKFYANDTWGNINVTGIYSLTTVAYWNEITYLNISSFDGTLNNWNTNGSSPYIDQPDNINYIYTTSSTAEMGYFKFENLSNYGTISREMLLEVRRNFNIEDNMVDVYLKNVNGTWHNIGNLGTAAGWQWITFNLTDWYFPTWRIDALELKFKATAISGATKKIDCARLKNVKYTIQNRTLKWIFNQMVARQVNSTFPLIRGYNDTSQTFLDTATPELLSGAMFYMVTKNERYLQYAYDYADWLNSSDVINLYKNYNVYAEQWGSTLGYEGCGRRLISLTLLANINSSYLPLVRSASNKYTNLYVNYSNYRAKSGGPSISLEKTAYMISAISYAYFVTGNETLKEIAVRMVMNWTLSGINLPYSSIKHNGDPVVTWLKRDEYFGKGLLGFETVYFFTENGTVKDKIKDVAEAGAQYFWRSEKNWFVYEVNAITGEYISSNTVHGFGYDDEAYILAYLLWGNETWFQRARKDFDTLVIDGTSPRTCGDILYNDLIVHSTNPEISQYDAADGWNAAAKRVALILYNLNDIKTGDQKNSSYLHAYNELYWATSLGHKRKLGWISVADARDFSNHFQYDGKLVDLFTAFRNFANITAPTIYTFNDVFKHFGIWASGALLPQEVHDVAVINKTTFSTVHGPAGSPYKPVTECYPTWTVEINVTVQNQGTASETFTVRAFYENATGNYTTGILPASYVVTLDPGASTSKVFTWDVPEIPFAHPYPTYTIYANVSVVPGETDTADNTRDAVVVTVKWRGDGNGDGYVGLPDLMILAMSYDKSPGDDGYNPQADYSGDGLIGLPDLMVLAMNYDKGPLD